MTSKNICIIDDEPELLGAYSSCLEEKYSVRCFTSAVQALQVFGSTSYHPDLVIIDFKMPGMDGFEFIDTLRARNFNNPLIVISGYAEKEQALQAVKYKVSAFLEKPFSVDALDQAVDTVVKEHLFQDKGQLLSLYQRFASLSAALNRLYYNRVIHAENRIQDLGLELYPSPSGKHDFLELLREEARLERQMSTISREIESALSKIQLN